MDPHNIALLCTIHPTSPSSRTTLLSSLTSASQSYYQTSKSQCTTWSYFLPSLRPKAPFQIVPQDEKDTLIGGMEIYSSKDALSTQQSEKWFKDYEKKVKEEGLVSRGGELVVWYPVAGFVSRNEGTVAGEGTVVMVAVFTCKEGGREAVVEVLRKYTEWVKENESGVLTYCTMTRPKEPNKVMLFERYKDHKALGAHGSTNEFKAMFKGIRNNIEVKQTKIQEFSEINGSFVGNVVGGAKSKGSSKL